MPFSLIRGHGPGNAGRSAASVASSRTPVREPELNKEMCATKLSCVIALGLHQFVLRISPHMSLLRRAAGAPLASLSSFISVRVAVPAVGCLAELSFMEG